jgi:serine/threonine protein kinase
VVQVLNFFRANETVYMVMQYERGRTLQEHIQKHKGEIRESFIRTVFARLLNGLREVHTHKLLHLDIKPSNVYLRNDGQPVLIDFGAARQTLSIDTPLLKPMYTPGFAAPEQYTTPGASCSGPGPTSTRSAPACMPAWPQRRRRRPTSASTATCWFRRPSAGLTNTRGSCWRPWTGACG